MNRRTLVLALTGAVLAGVLGFAVHLIAGDTVGTPASRIEATVPLAPPEAADPAPPRSQVARPSHGGGTTLRPNEPLRPA